MRPEVTKERLQAFLKHFGNELNSPSHIYLTGGATALLHDWRLATVDVDLKAQPEPARFFEVLNQTKEKLDINLELASPDQFIPELPGWQDRSRHIDRFGKTDFYHYDFYSQALAKIERGHPRDTADVEAMFQAGFLKSDRLLELFESVADQLIKFPAIDIPTFKEVVSAWVATHSS